MRGTLKLMFGGKATPAGSRSRPWMIATREAKEIL